MRNWSKVENAIRNIKNGKYGEHFDTAMIVGFSYYNAKPKKDSRGDKEHCAAVDICDFLLTKPSEDELKKVLADTEKNIETVLGGKDFWDDDVNEETRDNVRRFYQWQEALGWVIDPYDRDGLEDFRKKMQDMFFDDYEKVVTDDALLFVNLYNEFRNYNIRLFTEENVEKELGNISRFAILDMYTNIEPEGDYAHWGSPKRCWFRYFTDYLGKERLLFSRFVCDFIDLYDRNEEEDVFAEWLYKNKRKEIEDMYDRYTENLNKEDCDDDYED